METQVEIRQSIFSIFSIVILESQNANFVNNGRMDVRIWHNMRFVIIFEKKS